MDFFTRHREYLKDNPQGLWFKRKLYGWGWTPAKWQGWAVIGAFLVYLFVISYRMPEDTLATSNDLFWFFAELILGVAILIFVCYKKGEKPRWQWGLPEEPKR